MMNSCAGGERILTPVPSSFGTIHRSGRYSLQSFAQCFSIVHSSYQDGRVDTIHGEKAMYAPPGITSPEGKRHVRNTIFMSTGTGGCMRSDSLKMSDKERVMST